MDSLVNVSLFLSSCAAFYTLDIKTRNIYLQAISDGFHDNKITQSVLEEGAPPDPFAMTLTSDLTAAHIHLLCIYFVTQVLFLMPGAALCDPVSTNECICI